MRAGRHATGLHPHGDDGTTGRLFGGRASKADAAIEICGAIDEAVAALGVALAAIVLELQRGLFVAAADVAANPRARDRLVPGISHMTADMTSGLEQTIDRLVAERLLRPAFVVPGDTLPSAALDLARTSLRGAERLLVRACDTGTPLNGVHMSYLNRASDLAYVLARRAAAEQDEPLSHT